MPRRPARDTPAQRQLAIMNTVSRRLDELEDPDARARVLTWVDALVEKGDSVNEEIAAMKSIAAQFEGVSPDTREVVVRWLIENYGSDTRQEEVEPVEM